MTSSGKNVIHTLFSENGETLVPQFCQIISTEHVEKSFSELCSIETRANVRYIPGCGISCSKIESMGFQKEICPTCKEFIWHTECLLERFTLHNLQAPNLGDDVCKCIYCVIREKLKFLI